MMVVAFIAPLIVIYIMIGVFSMLAFSDPSDSSDRHVGIVLFWPIWVGRKVRSALKDAIGHKPK